MAKSIVQSSFFAMLLIVTILCAARIKVTLSKVSGSSVRPGSPSSLNRMPHPAEVEARREEEEFESLKPPMPEKLLAKWRAAASAYARFQHEFHDNGGGDITPEAKAALEEAAEHLKALARFNLGQHREFLLYGRLQDVYVPLARDVEHCGEAASWSLQRALNPIGTNSYAVDEGSENSLWNAGVSAAIGYYRRAGDKTRAEASLDVARKHPYAATHYSQVNQTPLVYHPNLTAKPWWDAQEFSLVRRLEGGYAELETRAAIEAELDALIASERLQVIISPAAPMQPPSFSSDAVECGSPGSTTENAQPSGSWYEFPLFDGKEWHDDALRALPTISRLLRTQDGGPDPCICTTPTTPEAPNLCGTSIVVSLMRLVPGAKVLPHCGVTNRRLTMQFALRGSDGVEFTVGGEARGYGGDGHAIVFDDSFEHSVAHHGSSDRYILYALLKHPDVNLSGYT